MSRVREYLESADTDFLFFSQTVCPYCTLATRTLEAHGLSEDQVQIGADAIELLAKFIARLALEALGDEELGERLVAYAYMVLKF